MEKVSYLKKKWRLAGVSTVLALSLATTSCLDDPKTQEGALMGAAAGAALGGIADGWKGAGRGAAIGAIAGGIIGHYRGKRYQGPSSSHSTSKFPYASKTDRYGFVRSPYKPYNVIDVKGYGRGDAVVVQKGRSFSLHLSAHFNRSKSDGLYSGIFAQFKSRHFYRINSAKVIAYLTVPQEQLSAVIQLWNIRGR